MFTHSSDFGYRDVLPGVRSRTLASGERTLLAEFRLARGALIPRHAHPHEQTGYLVSGALRLTVGEAGFEAGPGDSWCIEGGVSHGAVALEDSVAVEVFSPVREDYLPAAGGAPL